MFNVVIGVVGDFGVVVVVNVFWWFYVVWKYVVDGVGYYVDYVDDIFC